MSETTNTIKHLAIIMDGNRRWAKKHGLPAAAGHKQGAKNLEKICQDVKDLGIKYLTLYAFSTENWQRSKEEVDTLMNLMRSYLKDNLQELQKNNVKILFIGERSMLDKDIVERMNEIEKQTENNHDFTLCLAISYGSRQEIISAARKAAQLVESGDITIQNIDEELFSNLLYTKDIPDPDLLIRTSGEQRISNYLLWQIAYSELYFTEVMWPEFDRKELEKIIQNYHTRDRRYGKK